MNSLRAIVFILLTLPLLSCHKNVTLTPVSGQGYLYWQQEDDRFVVIHYTDDHLERAKAEIGCGVCLEPFTARITVIQVVK
jgi:hypothetical protein